MIVHVNKNEISIFSGASAGDAVRKYIQEHGKGEKAGQFRITDKNGNAIEPDGALAEGQQLFVEE